MASTARASTGTASRRRTWSTLQQAYETLYRSRLSFADAKAAIAEQGKSAPSVRILAEFLAGSVRGIIR